MVTRHAAVRPSLRRRVASFSSARPLAHCDHRSARNSSDRAQNRPIAMASGAPPKIARRAEWQRSKGRALSLPLFYAAAEKSLPTAQIPCEFAANRPGRGARPTRTNEGELESRAERTPRRDRGTRAEPSLDGARAQRRSERAARAEAASIASCRVRAFSACAPVSPARYRAYGADRPPHSRARRW